MIMITTTFFLLLVLQLTNCNIDVSIRNVNGLRDGSSSISSLLFVDLEKDAIRRITNSLHQSGQSINNVDGIHSQINGRQSLTNNGGRVTVVPARVDRLQLQPNFSNGVTLLATEPGSNPTQDNSAHARFFIPKNVKLPFINTLLHSQPGPFLTPPPPRSASPTQLNASPHRIASPIHSNNQHSHFKVTNSFIADSDRIIQNVQSTASPGPIFYFINNHGEINIPNIRHIVESILANNRVPIQQFDSSNIINENNGPIDVTPFQPKPRLSPQHAIPATLQPSQRNPSLTVELQPPSISPELNNLPPISTLIPIPNQQIPNFNIQTQPNNINPPQTSLAQGIGIQPPLITSSVTQSSTNNIPIKQQLTTPALNLPKPEAQVQQPHCLLCDLVNINNEVTTFKPFDLVQDISVHPNINNNILTAVSQRGNMIQVSSLHQKDLEALRIIVDGVLFRADHPDIGLHSSEIEDPGFFPHIKRHKDFIMMLPQSMLNMHGIDVI